MATNRHIWSHWESNYLSSFKLKYKIVPVLDCRPAGLFLIKAKNQMLEHSSATQQSATVLPEGLAKRKNPQKLVNKQCQPLQINPNLWFKKLLSKVEQSTFDRILIQTANIRLSMAYVEFKSVWPRQPNPDGRINKNRTAENKKPDGRTEWPNLTIRLNID